MKILENDIKWLKSSFPNLRYDAEAQKIEGELDFCAASTSVLARCSLVPILPHARYTYICVTYLR